MRGHNKVIYSGNVGGKIVHGQTSDNNPACSFSIASEQEGRPATWARINCYGLLASRLKGRIQKGDYVSVEGELMNRSGNYGELTEIRAKDVIIILESDNEEETHDTE